MKEKHKNKQIKSQNTSKLEKTKWGPGSRLVPAYLQLGDKDEKELVMSNAQSDKSVEITGKSPHKVGPPVRENVESLHLLVQ